MKTVIEMAREAEDKVIANPDLDWKREFAELVRAEEREACAKFFDGKVGQSDLRDIAAAIRARGNT